METEDERDDAMWQAYNKWMEESEEGYTTTQRECFLDGFRAATGRTDRERIEFIRRAAIAVWQESERGDDFAECWNVAEQLWQAKPEGL